MSSNNEAASTLATLAFPINEVGKRPKHKWDFSLEVKGGKGDLHFPFLDNSNMQEFCLLTGMQLHPFHLAAFGGKKRVLDDLTNWCNEWVAPTGFIPLQIITTTTLMSRYKNLADTAAKLADKNGPPWGDVEEFDGEKHTIRQQLYDMTIQILDDVNDMEKKKDEAKEAQLLKETQEKGQVLAIRNACMSTLVRRKEGKEGTEPDDPLSFLCTSELKTPKKEKKNSPTASTEPTFTEVILMKETNRAEEKKRKHAMDLHRDEKKSALQERKLTMYEKKMLENETKNKEREEYIRKKDAEMMEERKEERRLRELEINQRHLQQMKMLEAMLNAKK